LKLKWLLLPGPAEELMNLKAASCFYMAEKEEGDNDKTTEIPLE
jgi:hypothetical protein